VDARNECSENDSRILMLLDVLRKDEVHYMMSLSAIQQVSRDAAIRAARDNRIPFTVEDQDIAIWKARFKAGNLKFPFPFLGAYVPHGWRRTDRKPLFVDSSGFGREDELALTVTATIEALIPGKAYAIIESGQFQLHLAEYERDDSSQGNADNFTDLTSQELEEFQAEFSERPDIEITAMPCGDLAFNPMTETAARWVLSYMFRKPQSCGGIRGVLVVEAPYAKDVIRAMKNDGLQLRWKSD
jgi:hypothetical protein